uniref:Lectin n=1 Tax=Pteria penguin TaxID=113549 RepID=Q9GRC1_PTEPN|nr:lectin [Pteria penguin]
MLVIAVLMFCVPSLSALRESDVEEGKTSILNCPAQYKISLIDAKYGLHNRFVTATKKAAALCNGKKQCSIKASNGVFGDPYKGKKKRLLIKYSCAHNGETSTKIANGKEHTSSASLKCSGIKYTIRVIEAEYGISQRWNDGTSKVRKMCDGLKECMVPAVNYMFGDPAVGKKKDLRVRYKCTS